MRRDPVESSRTNLSRNAPRCMSSTRSATVQATSSSMRTTPGRDSSEARWSRTSRCRSRPMARFSATVSDGTSRASWNERPRPRAARRSGECAVMSSPSRRIRPSSGFVNPEMRSKIVVLPAPFGPIRPRISPSPQVEAGVVDGADPAEALDEPVDLEHDWSFGQLAGACAATALAGTRFLPVATAAPSRNTERTMSSRSRSSAVGPSKRTSPFSMKYARSASGEGDVDRLLDEQDRRALLLDAAHDDEQLLDDRRGQAEGQLVDDEQLRLGDEGHRQRQHLLLAAREVAGHLVDALLEAREDLEHRRRCCASRCSGSSR